MKRRDLSDALLEAESVAEVYRLYERHVMPPTAGEGQRIETRRAIYAGVDWMIKRLMAATEDEEAAMQLLADISRECEEFGRSGGVRLPS